MTPPNWQMQIKLFLYGLYSDPICRTHECAHRILHPTTRGVLFSTSIIPLIQSIVPRDQIVHNSIKSYQVVFTKASGGVTNVNATFTGLLIIERLKRIFYIQFSTFYYISGTGNLQFNFGIRLGKVCRGFLVYGHIAH